VLNWSREVRDFLAQLPVRSAADHAPFFPPYPFEPIKVDTGSVAVRAGRWAITIGGQVYDIPLTVDGGGTSVDVDDLLTLTVQPTTPWLVLKFDDADEPAALTVEQYADFPNTGWGTTYWPIAFCVFDGDDYITEVIPLWRGGNVYTHRDELDGVSLNRNASTPHADQLLNWAAGAATTPCPADGEVVIRPAAHGNLIYSSIFDLIDALTDWAGIDLSGATGDWTEEITALAHSVLFDVLAGTAGNDHSLASGNYSYIGNTGDYDNNAMDYGLGDSAGNPSVSANDRILMADSQWVLNWLIGIAYDAAEAPSLDWFLRQLIDDWEVTGTTAATDDNVGALVTAGGIGCGGTVAAHLGFQIGAGATNAWTVDDLLATVSGDVALMPGGDLILGVNGGNIQYGDPLLGEQVGQTIADWVAHGGITGPSISELTGVYFHDHDGNEIGPYNILVRQ